MNSTHPVLTPTLKSNRRDGTVSIRTRSRSFGSDPGGAAYKLQITVPDVFQTNGFLYDEETIDVPDGDFVTTNQFDNYRDSNSAGYVTGKISAYYNCEQWSARNNFTARNAGLVGGLSDAAAVTIALARANPSRPTVDIAQFLGELRDLPRMVFQIGDILRRIDKASKLGRRFVPTANDVASGFLGWTFGWDPLISDLRKLFDFSEAVSNRTKELKALKAGDLRRTITVAESRFPVTGADAYYGPLYQNNFHGYFTYDHVEKKWVRIRYKPTSETIRIIGDDLLSTARSLVFGHNLHYSTVWELMPWSWLIDWFSTAGDYFAANRNHLAVEIADIAVMTYVQRRPMNWTYTGNPFGAKMAVNRDASFHWKRRRKLSGPSITAKVPFLSLKQWSILSALAVIRLR